MNLCKQSAHRIEVCSFDESWWRRGCADEEEKIPYRERIHGDSCVLLPVLLYGSSMVLKEGTRI